MSSPYQCPNDGHSLRFEGIEFREGSDSTGRPVTLKWFRWDACDFCKTWYIRRETGAVIDRTKVEPPKSAFITEREGRS